MKFDPINDFDLNHEPEWTLDGVESDLLECYYSFNWEQVQDTLAKLRRLRYVKPADAREEMIKKLLPVVDGFELLFKLAHDKGADDKEELKNWISSFEGVYKRLLKVLSQQGVEPIESIGQAVDLDFHEVVKVEDSEEIPAGTIIKEQQKGYVLADRVLRDAKVVVAKKSNKNTEQDGSSSADNKEEVL